ncbi:hypothetical protein XavaCFBP5823_21070 [Xanthomonas axonopodis pv. vasculorum]|nr:hypothetical protein XavaCFBP5823_21070 [Xanthomonas axonopodis pv. vasculorum]
MLRPLFCVHCLAPLGAACFGEEQAAARSPGGAEGSGNPAPAQAPRVADARSSMACNGQLSSACHISHVLLEGLNNPSNL